MQIVCLNTPVEMEEKAASLFTSANGVRFAPPALRRRAYCVGERTTDAAREAGWDAEYAGPDAEGLIDYLNVTRPSVPLYHFCGVHVRGNIVERLSTSGLIARKITIYDQVLLPLSAEALAAMSSDQRTIVPLFSPRAAAHFATEAPSNSRVRVVALSASVAGPLKKIRRFETVVAAEPTLQSMLTEIEILAQKRRLG